MTFSRIYQKIKGAFEFCPKGKNESFQVHLFESLDEVPADFYSMLSSQADVFLTPGYLKALENSKPPDMHFAYACVEKNGQPAAFMYFQLVQVRFDDAGSFLNPKYFGKALATLGKGRNHILFRGLFSTPAYIMFCGNVFLSGEHGIYIKAGTEARDLDGALPALMDEIISSAGDNGKIAGVVVKDFYEAGRPRIPVLEKEGYRQFYFEPNMIMDIRPAWSNFEDYLNDLSSKYRVRAKNVLKKGAEISIKEFSEKEIKQHAAIIQTLYRNVHRKAAVHFSEVNASYFAGLKNKLKDQFIFKGFYMGEKLVAFSTAIVSNDHFEAHLVGIDYEYNKSHSLYPLMLYDYIDEAISNRVRVINFGRTALEIKSTVGAKPVPLYCYIGLQKPLSIKLLEPFFDLSVEKDLVVRDPFKEMTEPVGVRQKV